jgi:hypothetical protein
MIRFILLPLSGILELFIIMFACTMGLIEYFELPVIVASLISVVLVHILFIFQPLLLSIIGILGAIFGWHWNPFAAIAFFVIGPIIVSNIILGPRSD